MHCGTAPRIHHVQPPEVQYHISAKQLSLIIVMMPPPPLDFQEYPFILQDSDHNWLKLYYLFTTSMSYPSSYDAIIVFLKIGTITKISYIWHI